MNENPTVRNINENPAVKTETAPPAGAENKVAELYNKQAPEGWMAELQSGNIRQAQELLEQEVAEAVKPVVTRDILAHTAELVRAELETRQYVDELRRQMPEVAPLEPYIAAYVERRMAVEGQQAGSIADYVETYKRVVKEEMEKARNLVQPMRAAGVDQALGVKQEVMSASIVKPSEVDKGVVTEPPKPKPLTPEEYFQTRMAAYRRSRGFGTPNSS